MLSIQQCRQHLGKDSLDMTDEQVEELRSDLYKMAELSLDVYFDKLKKKI